MTEIFVSIDGIVPSTEMQKQKPAQKNTADYRITRIRTSRTGILPETKLNWKSMNFGTEELNLELEEH